MINFDIAKYEATRPDAADFNMFQINVFIDEELKAYTLKQTNDSGFVAWFIEDALDATFPLHTLTLKNTTISNLVDSQQENIEYNWVLCLTNESFLFTEATAGRTITGRAPATIWQSCDTLPNKIRITIVGLYGDADFKAAQDKFIEDQHNLDISFRRDLMEAYDLVTNSGAHKLMDRLIGRYGIGNKAVIIKDFEYLHHVVV